MTDTSYKKSGVDIEAGERAVNSIQDMVAGTHSGNVLKGIGLFSGFYELDIQKYKKPVIVSSIDGVGTKVKIAELMGVYDTVGQDLVNHCINDIAVCGASPLVFLDYIAADKLDVQVVSEIVKGMAVACKESGCALVGGETAEMPGVYMKDNFDLAGSITGVVEKDEIIDGSEITQGNVLIGVPSSGLHTNGFSLVRHILFEENKFSIGQHIPEFGQTLGEELLAVHKSYLHLIQAAIKTHLVLGIAHITGGGIVGNTSRLLPENLGLRINWNAWTLPPLFEFLQKKGNVSFEEMQKAFNLGVGLIFIVAESAAEKILEICKLQDESAFIMGEVVNL